jgi:PAS domain S-box-containing protein
MRNAACTIAPAELEELQRRLQEAEDMLEVIRAGAVDALVVQRDDRPQVYTLESADYSYRVVLNTMHEGVLTLTPDRSIAYCNQRFSELVDVPSANILGRRLGQFFEGEPANAISALLEAAKDAPQVAELDLIHEGGAPIPVRVSVTAYTVDQIPMFSVLVTDLTEQKRAQRDLEEHQRSLRSLVAELALAEERERRTLATAVHDSVGQSLAFTRLKLSMARSHVKNEPLSQDLEEVDGLLQQAIQETRSLTIDLSPPVLYRLGFEAAVTWLAEDMQRKHGFNVHVHHDEHPKPLSEDIRVILFQAVREILTNAAKHAEATDVDIAVRADDRKIKVQITDNGKGFDPKAVRVASDSTSFGLFNIQERLTHVAGDLQISSKIGEGSRFVLTAPLDVTQPSS